MLRRATLALAVLLGSACTEIVGAGEYKVGDRTDVDNPCGPDEVLTDGRSCVEVGVPADQCGEGFEPAPSGGCSAVLPDQECTENSFAYPGLPDCAFRPDYCHSALYPSTVGLPVDRFLYVDSGSNGCIPDGTIDCPYSTIGQAVVQARADTSGNRRTILVRSGDYFEDVVVDASGVSIEACAARVTLHGVNARPTGPYPCGRLQASKDANFASERQAALCIAPGADDVTIKNLIVTGPGDGIQVVGAKRVRITESRIADTGTYGLRIQEAGLGTPGSSDWQVVSSEVALEDVIVSEAHAVGIFVSGSDLTINRSSIQLTGPLNPAPDTLGLRPQLAMGWARGLAIRPSGWAADGASTDPESFGQSHVTITGSAITGNPEVGLSIEGASVTVEHSFIGALPRGEVSGLGIFVGRAISSGTVAELTVSQSVIERTSDAAIDVLDAKLVVTNTTIRDTRGRTGDGCSGQGIRVRSLPPGDARSTVDVDHSVIVESRQAAVLAGSSTVTLTDSLLRGIAPEGNEAACIQAMGDGVSLVDLPDQPPAQALLERVRIDGAHRAAVVKPREATLSLTSVVLACSPRFVVEGGAGEGALGALGGICGCDEIFQSCERETESVPSWIVAGASPAWPGNIYERTQCLRDFGSAQIPIVGAAVWRSDAPEIAPALSLADGCCRISGPVSVESSPVTTWKPGFLGANSTRDASQLIARTLSLQAQPLLSLPIGLGFPIDLPWSSINEIQSGHTISLQPPIPVFLFGSFEPLTGPVPGAPGSRALLIVTQPEPGWVHVSVDGPSIQCEPTTALGGLNNPNEAWVFLDGGLKSFLNFFNCRTAQ